MNAPSSISEEDTTLLKQMAEDFPASATIQWLYLKGLQNQESYLFSSQLSKTAIASVDRTKLHAWIEQEVVEPVAAKRFDFKIPEEEEEKQPEVQAQTQVVEQSLEQEQNQDVQDTGINIVIPEKEPSEAQKLEVDPLEVKVPDQEKETQRAVPKTSKPAPPKNLPPDILAILERSKKIRADYHEDHEDQEEVKEQEQVQPEVREEHPEAQVEEEAPAPIKLESAASPEDLSMREDIELETEGEEKEPELVEDETPALAFEIDLPELEEPISLDLEIDEDEEGYAEEGEEVSFGSFSEWLKFKSEGKMESKGEEEEVPVIPQVETHTQEQEQEQEQENVQEPLIEEALENEEISIEPIVFNLSEDPDESPEMVEMETAVLSHEKKKAIALVDKFLERKPKIKPSPEAPRNTDGLGLGSRQSPEFITQTLAQIYIKQGHFERAIEAYEILRLKYPEKSGFFADRIREVKTLKNKL